MSVLKKLVARNDDAHAEIVLPITFFVLFMSFIFTGTAVVLATQSEERIAFDATSGLAVVSWAILALLAKKYSRISM